MSRHVRDALAALAHPASIVIAAASVRALGVWVLLAPIALAPLGVAALSRRRAMHAHALGLALALPVPTAIGLAHDASLAATRPELECSIPLSAVLAFVTPFAWLPYAVTTSAVLAVILRALSGARARGLARLRSRLVAARPARHGGPYRFPARRCAVRRLESRRDALIEQGADEAPCSRARARARARFSSGGLGATG